MEKIDTLDKKILEIIMNNARIPSKDVAQVCGVSRAAVHQRIEAVGVVIDFRGVLDVRTHAGILDMHLHRLDP